MSRSSPGSDFATEEYALPCVEAVLAGTLETAQGTATATSKAALRLQFSSAGIDSAQVNMTLTNEAGNLGVLADHPQLSEPMRQMLARLIARWEPVARSALAGELALPEKALWLRSPATVQ